MDAMDEFKYLTKDELAYLVGVELLFLNFADQPIRGYLQKDNNRFWLPSCCGVDATTVKIKVDGK